MERKPTSKHARTRSGAGSAGSALASFLRSTAASFSSSTTTNFAPRAGGGGGKSSFNHRNAFSGPMVSIVPPEARRKRGSRQQGGGGGSGYRTPEASSPKVSCIGQIKRSKSKRKTKASRKAKTAPVACGMDGGACPLPPRPPAASRPKRSLVKRMLFRRTKSRSSSSSNGGASVAAAPGPAPAAGLGQMKRFTSGRAAFQDFDWTDLEAEPRRGSDVDAGADGYDSYEDDGFVAHSAPLVLGCGMDGGACPLPPRPPAASRPKRSLVKRMLFRRTKSRSSSSNGGASVAAAPGPAPAAGLGQMKRFTSGRAAFQDFDWKDQEAEPRRGSDVDAGGDGYDSYEDDGFVAHSAPLVLGGGMVASEPRKEVNLWRRRPMSPPTRLQLP